MNAILLDLGGTHLRLATLKNSTIGSIELFESPTSEKDLFAKVAAYFKNHPGPTDLFASIAGPIELREADEVVKLTNLGFFVSKKAFEDTTHLKVHFINDLHALAMAIPFLPAESLKTIISAKMHVKQSRIGIVSCGTGLGVSFLNEDARSIPSEGGHIEFAPTTDVEWELFKFFKTKFPHVSYERVIAGSSQEAYFDFFKNKDYLDPNRVWWEILGRFVSSIALMNLCHGGIFLAGGYLRSKQSELSKYKEVFTASFLDKGRLSNALKMGVSFVHHANPELLGLEKLAIQRSGFSK